MEGRVAEAAGRDANGAQGWAGVRDFRQSRQGIRQVVKIVCEETEIRVGMMHKAFSGFQDLALHMHMAAYCTVYLRARFALSCCTNIAGLNVA